MDGLYEGPKTVNIVVFIQLTINKPAQEALS